MQVLVQDGSSSEALRRLACIWLVAGRAGQAVAHARALAQLQPQSYQASQLLADCLWWACMPLRCPAASDTAKYAMVQISLTPHLHLSHISAEICSWRSAHLPMHHA